MKRNQNRAWFLSTIFPAGVGIALLGIVAATPVTADDFATANGDVNASGLTDLSDAVYLLQYLFRGGPEPKPLACGPGVTVLSGDVNGSGAIDIGDAICLITYLYYGGPVSYHGCSP